MDLAKKLEYVEQYVKNIAQHEDAEVKSVIASLESVKTIADTYIKDVYARRVGNRLVAYIKRLVAALVGKSLGA